MRIWKETAAVSAAALLGVFLLPLAWAHEPVKVETPPELTAGRQTAEPSAPRTDSEEYHDRQQTLRVLDGDTVRDMTMEDYLMGVTAAEMPASFAFSSTTLSGKPSRCASSCSPS